MGGLPTPITVLWSNRSHLVPVLIELISTHRPHYTVQLTLLGVQVMELWVIDAHALER